MAPLAFQAFLLLLLFLPGAVALYTFGGKFTPGNTLPNLSLAPTHRAVIALVVALVLHGIWLLGVAGIQLAGGPYRPDAELILQLLASSATLPSYTATLDRFSANWGPMAAYFISILIGGGIGGFLLQKLLRQLKLDRRIPALRFEHPWHYVLTAEMADFPEYSGQFPDVTGDVWVAAAVEIAGTAYVIQGLLEAWWCNTEGQLDRMMLSSVERTPLPLTQEQTDAPDSIFLPADFFMLEYAKVQSLSLNYFQAVRATGGGTLPALKGEGTGSPGL